MLFIRILFTLICMAFLTLFAITTNEISLNTVLLGSGGGLGLGVLLIGLDQFMKGARLRSFNTITLGLIFGYLMGQAVLLVATTLISEELFALSPNAFTLMKTTLFLTTTYFGLILTMRASEELELSLPFVKFKSSSPKKKDVLLDGSVLLDSRIIDIATSGLLDDQLILPRFMVKEQYLMLESSDESTKLRAKRCLEVLRKLEGIPTLNLRYTETDFTEIRDSASKLIHLALLLDTNVLTADVTRFQQYATEGVRIINIHMLSTALKPMVTGEHLTIKIQRYGKEPRQGVGYLDDGTMVVVNGGAEFIGETIKAQVLSVKHTSSGRMIFCNVMDDSFLCEQEFVSAATGMEPSPKNYFAL